MANCKQCGAQLPTFSFGEVSPYCKTCAAQQPPAVKQSLEDVLAPVSVAFSSWLNATNALIAVNAAVFLAMVATGVSWMEPTTDDLLRWGADYGPNTLSGQYWRLATAAFVHIGLPHILLNMWCLWSLGRLLERLLGPFVVCGVYLLTGIGASLLSLSWEPMRVSAGASGAIFGIAGALIPVLYYGNLGLPKENVRKLLRYVVQFSLINLLYGLRGHVNNMAHLGGLVTGLLLGIFLARSFSLPQEERRTQHRNVLVVGALALVILTFPIAKAKSYAVEMRKGQLAYNQKDFKSAIEHLTKYTAAQPNDAYAHATLGGAYHERKLYEEASREYLRALELEPNYAFAQVNLARVYLALDKPEQAVEMFRASISRLKPNADDYFWYAMALKQAGDLSGAESAVRRAIELDPKDADNQSLLVEITEAKRTAAGSEKVTRKNVKAAQISR